MLFCSLFMILLLAGFSVAQIVTRPRLQELVREVDPTEQLDEEVEELLLQLADDFIDTTMNAACLLAKHRHVPTVEVKDVQLHLGNTVFMILIKLILTLLRVLSVKRISYYLFSLREVFIFLLTLNFITQCT